jgi:hypothetical protein
MSLHSVSAVCFGLSLFALATNAQAARPTPPRAVSPFFPALDELCPQVRSSPPEAPFRPDIRAYCVARDEIPPFAAKREAERLAILDDQRSIARQPSAKLVQVPPLPPVRSLFEQAPLPADIKPPGVMTLEALALTLHEACSPAAVKETLPSTCAAPNRLPFSLGSVREGLIDDASLLASKGLAELGRAPGVERVVLVLSTLVGVLQGDDIPELLSRLDRIVEGKVGGAAGSPALGAAAATATEIAVRILRDGPILDKPRTHYERVVAEVLAERIHVGRVDASAPRPELGFPSTDPGGPGFDPRAPLTPRQAELTSRLVSCLGALERGRREMTQHAATPPEVAAVTLATLDAVTIAYEIASPDSKPLLDPETRETVARVAAAATAGDVKAVADLTAEQIDAMEKAGILSSTAACTSRTALRVAFTQNDAEMRRALLTCVVELPLWTDKLLFAAHAGLPIFDSTTTRIDGDLLLGYNGDSFGISGFGSLYNYDVSDSTGRSETFRAEGSGEIWGSLKVGPLARLEGRLAGGGALYNTDVYPSRRGYYEETSVMGRGSALLGVRLTPSPRFVLAAHGGGGVQVEIWDGTQIPAAGRKVVLTDEIPVTARAVGRLRAQWNTWPNVFSLRASTDFDYLSITRAKEVTTLGSAGLVTTVSESSTRQFELFARGYVDVDYLEFFSFRPVVHGGANVVGVDGDTAVVPVFGAGIRRESF